MRQIDILVLSNMNFHTNKYEFTVENCVLNHINNKNIVDYEKD